MEGFEFTKLNSLLTLFERLCEVILVISITNALHRWTVVQEANASELLEMYCIRDDVFSSSFKSFNHSVLCCPSGTDYGTFFSQISNIYYIKNNVKLAASTTENNPNSTYGDWFIYRILFMTMIDNYQMLLIELHEKNEILTL